MDDHGLDIKLLERLLKQKYHDGKPVDVVSADVNLAVPVGDNYGSVVYRVKFNVMTASGKSKKRSLVVKTVATWIQAIETGTTKMVSPTFRSEIKIYKNILPFMEELMEEFDDRRSKLWPEMIGYFPYNMIAFEDLTESLYIGPDKKKCMNLKESLLVLRSIGRFHAMSKVLLERGYISDEDKGQLMLACETEFFERMWTAYFTVLTNSMDDWGQEWKAIANKLLRLSPKVNKKWAELGRTYDKKFEVLNHGDLWTCNLLFQRMEFEDIPVSMKFVDFQCTHLNSFAWDVEYFMHTSTIASVRRANMDLLHATYQESLEKNLKFFNYTGYIPTLDDVKAESKRIEFASMSCTIFQPIMVSGQVIGIDKVMTHSPEHVLQKSVFSEGRAQETIGEDLRKFYDSGVMDII